MVNLGSGIISQVMRNSSAENLAEYHRRSLAMQPEPSNLCHFNGIFAPNRVFRDVTGA